MDFLQVGRQFSEAQTAQPDGNPSQRRSSNGAEGRIGQSTEQNPFGCGRALAPPGSFYERQGPAVATVTQWLGSQGTSGDVWSSLGRVLTWSSNSTLQFH